MRRLLALVLIAALIAAAVFLADHPGKVDIVWQGWLVETSVGVLIAAAVLGVLVVVGVIAALALVLGSPRALLRRRRERRRSAGYRALTQGMVAVAAGDAAEAQRQAKKADLLLADPPLTLLLSAQAAQLDGDEAAAGKFFAAMLGRPETEFLGLRGLIGQALARGDETEALQLAERARSLRPSTPWVFERLFDLEVRQRRWETALETLADAEKHRLLPKARARRHRGMILYELSLVADRNGDRRRAIALAARAQSLVPDSAGVAAHHARLLLAEGRLRQATKAVERAWRSAPQPGLARVWLELSPDEPPLARLKRVERLVSLNPSARESHLVAAEAALDARLWGEARRHLDRALALPAPAGPAAPSQRLCRLMARLEEAEHGADGKMRAWLDDAVGAMPDPAYVCSACGAENRDWQPLCSHCGAFDTLSWRTPARAVVHGPAPAQFAVLPAAES
jgi:HemY protein